MTNFLADLALASAAFGAAFFCIVLSRKLAILGRADTGIGASLASLSEQSRDLAATVAEASRTAAGVEERIASLEAVTERAEMAAKRLELLMAAVDAPGKANGQAFAARGDADSATESAGDGPIFRRREMRAA